MRKLVKLLIIVAAILIVAYIAIAISLNTFLNPKNFKTKLLNIAQQKLERPVTLGDDLSWSLFPHIALKLNDLKVGNPAGFNTNTFVEATQIKLNVRLLPLLRGKIEIASISIDGLNAYLIKNVQGKTNWTISSTATDSSNKPANQNDTPTVTASKNLALTISNLDITDSTVIWENQQTQQTIKLDKLQLHGKDINFTQAFPVKLSFRIANKAQTSVPLDFNLKAQLLANPEKGIYSISGLNSSLGQTHLKGNANFTQAKISQVNFDINIDTLNLDNYKKLLSSNSKAAAQNNSSAAASSATDNKSSLSVLNDFNIAGKINIEKLIVNHLTLQNLHVNANSNQGLLKLAPITANLYQGNLTSTATVDARAAIPRYAINGNINNIQLGDLLKDVTGKSTMTGTTNINADVTTQGEAKPTLMKNLNGNAKLAINNGSIGGMDIFGLIRQASAFISSGSGKINLSNETKFSSLTGTAAITNGLVKNNDLVLKSANLTANGNGTVNLVTEQINYRILAAGSVNEKNTVDIPVVVSGSLSNPRAFIDLQSLAKKAAVKQLGKQIEKQIGAPVQDLLNKISF